MTQANQNHTANSHINPPTITHSSANHPNLHFTSVQLEHRPLISSYLQDHPYNTMEYSFTTLFIWQESYGFAWAEKDHVLYIRSCYQGVTKFFPPIVKTAELPYGAAASAYENALREILTYCRENHITPIFEEITEQDRATMFQYLKEEFLFQSNRDLANYIYYVSTLTHLRGRSFNGKRNHIRHFETENPTYRFLPLTEDLLPACKSHAESWYAHHPEKNQPTLIEERIALLKSLDFFPQLELVGGVILINGVVEGFAIGEPLNQNMAVIHFEKGNPHINGIYTALNKYFLAASWQDYHLVNRAEDLGLPGLKKAKKDYKPAWLEMKYTATPIEQPQS